IAFINRTQFFHSFSFCPLSLAALDSSPARGRAKSQPIGYCLPRARGRWPAGPERAIIHYYCTTFSAKKIAAFARVHRRRTHGAGGRACISCILCRQKMKVFQLFTLFSPFFGLWGQL